VGVIGQGDVQWMTAGSGVLHKEYHEAEYSQRGGLFQMVQLWVNLPSRFKMTNPGYQGITHDQMGVFKLPDEKGIVEVVAGDFLGVKGPATTFSPIQLYNLRLKKGADLKFNLPANYNTGILVVEGEVKINSSDRAPEDHFVLFKNEGEEISLEVESDSVLLVVSGEPINEPIAAYGPFLMNRQDEIIEAVNDFNTGKFGYLKD
jgi:redox-sensitive bicupin YhaK (pirin superfamily)